MAVGTYEWIEKHPLVSEDYLILELKPTDNGWEIRGYDVKRSWEYNEEDCIVGQFDLCAKGDTHEEAIYNLYQLVLEKYGDY